MGKRLRYAQDRLRYAQDRLRKPAENVHRLDAEGTGGHGAR
jgi:hypothetical protein